METFGGTEHREVLLVGSLQPADTCILPEQGLAEAVLIYEEVFQQLGIVAFGEEYLLFLYFRFL